MAKTFEGVREGPRRGSVGVAVEHGKGEIQVTSSAGLWDRIADEGGGVLHIKREIALVQGKFNQASVRYEWPEPIDPSGGEVYEERAPGAWMKRFYTFDRYELTTEPGSKVAKLDRPYEGPTEWSALGVCLDG